MMKLTHTLAGLVLLFSLSISNAQKIKIKKGVISVDGKSCLTTDGDAINKSFYDADGEEIVFLKYLTDRKDGENYMKITFLDQKISLTSKSILFTRKMLIRRLLASKVIVDCKLNTEKIERFILKYDENIEQDDINVHVSIDRN